jgi:hypothetical protein
MSEMPFVWFLNIILKIGAVKFGVQELFHDSLENAA